MFIGYSKKERLTFLLNASRMGKGLKKSSYLAAYSALKLIFMSLAMFLDGLPFTNSIP
jgi:hypothetical protein